LKLSFKPRPSPCRIAARSLADRWQIAACHCAVQSNPG
jgi:hypothetical protein